MHITTKVVVALGLVIHHSILDTTNIHRLDIHPIMAAEGVGVDNSIQVKVHRCTAFRRTNLQGIIKVRHISTQVIKTVLVEDMVAIVEITITGQIEDLRDLVRSAWGVVEGHRRLSFLTYLGRQHLEHGVVDQPPRLHVHSLRRLNQLIPRPARLMPMTIPPVRPRNRAPKRKTQSRKRPPSQQRSQHLLYPHSQNQASAFR